MDGWCAPGFLDEATRMTKDIGSLAYDDIRACANTPRTSAEAGRHRVHLRKPARYLGNGARADSARPTAARSANWWRTALITTTERA
jgi:hypothetical protein